MPNMTLTDFEPEKIQERQAKEAEKIAREEEDRRIMDLLGRFTAEMLRDGLFENGGHPFPEWGDYESWRYHYQEECSRRGRRLLTQLGWPTENESLYVNLNTGCIETLWEICTFCWRDHDGLDPVDDKVWTVIEHWEPYDPSRPNIYLINYLGRELARLHQLKERGRRERLESYEKSDIKKIPAVEKQLADARANRGGLN